MPLRLHYNAYLPVVLGCLGVYSVWRALNGGSYTESGEVTSWLMAGASLFIAGLALFVPHADVDEQVCKVYGFIPLFWREFHYPSLRYLALDDDYLYVRVDGEWQRLPVYRKFVRADEWATLEKLVSLKS